MANKTASARRARSSRSDFKLTGSRVQTRPLLQRRLPKSLHRWQVAAFGVLTPRELRALANVMRREEHRPGEFLFHTGDRAERVYFLRKGLVKISVVSAEGEERILELLRHGDTFGELFLMTSERRIFSAQAMTSTTVYTVSGRDFLTLITRWPALWRSFAMHLIRTQRRSILRLQGLLHVRAGLRLLMVLLDLGRRLGRRRTDEEWTLPRVVKQDDIAGMLGVNRSTVSTLINAYRRKGVLSGRRGTLVVSASKAARILEEAGIASP